MEAAWNDSSWNNFQILAGCTASAVHLWDPWTPAHTPVRPSEAVSTTAGPRRTLCWNANGKVLSYGGRFPYIVMQSGRDVELGLFPTMNKRKPQPWPASATINTLSFSRKSHYMLAGSDEGTLYVLNCKAQELAWKATKHASAITSLAVAPDNDTFATASADAVLLYSMEAEQRAVLDKRPSGDSAGAVPIGCCDEVSSLAFSELDAAPADRAALRGMLLAAVGGNGSAVVWRVADRSIAASCSALHQGPATGVAFGHEGPHVLYTCGLDRHLLTLDLRNPRQAAQKAVGPAPLTCLSVRYHSHNLAAGTSGGSMLIYDTRQLQSPLDELVTGGGALLDLAWQPFKPSSRSSSAGSALRQTVLAAPLHGLSPVQETPPAPSPALDGTPGGPDSPFMVELSPAPAGITPMPAAGTPTRRPAPEGILGDSISIPSFADLADASPSPPAPGPQRRIADDAAPMRQPNLSSAAAPEPTTTQQPSTSLGLGALGRSSTQPAAGTSAPAAAGSAAGGSKASALPRSVSAAGQAASSQALNNSPTKPRVPGAAAAANRYGSSSTASYTAAPSGLAKVYTTSTAAGPSSLDSPLYADDSLHRNSSLASLRSTAAGVGLESQQVQRGAGGRFITEEIFHSYNKAMEERLQESMQDIHLDMIRSFHMLQAEMLQLVDALAKRQDDIEGHVLKQQALLERLLQRNQSSSWL